MTEGTDDIGVLLRRQQRIDELCGAAIRALSGRPDVRSRGGRLYRGSASLALRAPHLHPRPGTDDFHSFRGAADGVALRLRHSDAALHELWCPVDPVARLVFDLLEQYRVESLADPPLVGVVANLCHRHREWSLAFHRSGLTETWRGLVLYTVAQISRASLTGEPAIAETEELIESTRFALAPVLGEDLAGLRRHRGDQPAYAVHALSIATAVAQVIEDLGEPCGARSHSTDDPPPTRQEFTLWEDVDEAGGEGGASAPSTRPSALTAVRAGYRVFTTAYDEKVAASSVVRRELLAAYRAQLDHRIVERGINVARLTRRIMGGFLAPARAGWDGENEEGTIDGRLLVRLVTTPGERRLFRIEHGEPVADLLVTFLVDCSGSMKPHALSVAVLLDVFARAIEQAGASCEILGFTTGAWNGGRAMRDWRRAGRPAHPGRLNERRHLIFKSAESSWRQARPAVAALLHADLYREGVEGEAVEWASARAAVRDEPRKLLFVVSDGSPMDSATAVTNGPHYLDRHLREVVAGIEQSGGVEIFGVGVGLDLSTTYRRSRLLDLAEGASNAIFGEVLDLLVGERNACGQH